MFMAIALATLFHGGASAAQSPALPAPAPSPAPAESAPLPANAAIVAQAREQFCNNVTTLYSTVISMSLSAPKPELAVNGTVQRHETLQRLLTMAWAENCNLAPLFNLEREKIVNQINGQAQQTQTRP